MRIIMTLRFAFAVPFVVLATALEWLSDRCHEVADVIYPDNDLPGSDNPFK
jgi:hypothetical protein